VAISAAPNNVTKITENVRSRFIAFSGPDAFFRLSQNQFTSRKTIAEEIRKIVPWRKPVTKNRCRIQVNIKKTGHNAVTGFTFLQRGETAHETHLARVYSKPTEREFNSS